MTMRICLAVAAALSLSAATAGGVFDVRAFGAKGDGLAKDTASIQAAVDAAEKAGGGEVYLGAGTYLSGSVYLKDNVDFHLGPGAVLLGSANPLDYSDPYAFKLNNPIWPSESSFGAHLLVCYERKNVTVRGPGRIDGNAKAFLVSPEGKVYDQGSIPWRPSQMLWFCQSEDVRVTDLEIANSTQWSCFFHGCDRVKVRGCRVHNNRFRRGTFHTHNGDGIDVDCCRWVSISDCDIDVADDGITLRASPRGEMRNRECAFVTVSNCRISSECNAVRVGVGSGRIHDAVFSNLSVYETRIAFNFASSWSRAQRGCDFANIRFENCALDCGQFLFMSPIYATETTARDISFSGITGRSYRPGRASWTPGKSGRLLFRDVDLACGIARKDLPEMEIAGGTLKEITLPDDQFGLMEWSVSDWGGYSNWGDCGYRKYANRKWKLVWSDEFDGEKLDETKWVCERGIIRNPGTEHTYTDDPENVRVEKGVLVLEARRKTVQNPKYEPGSTDFRKAKETHYTSGSVETLGKYDFTYGRVEVRAKVPAGRGMWPAIWMMGSNITKCGWPRCGELDVMEFVGSDPGGVYGTMHWFDPVHPQKPSAATGGTTSFGQRLEKRTPTDGFHIYAIEWDRDEIVFYYDNERYFSYDVNLATLQGTGPVSGEYNPFRLPMYLKLNLALGGGWAGKVDPACVPGRFEVDYVRVYERER